MRLFRTEYQNPDGTVRHDSTGHGESLVDFQDYLEPLRGALLSVLVSPGVADGLQVSAVIGQAGLSVSTGVGVDAQGRVAVLSDGGAAVIDPAAPVSGVQGLAWVNLTGPSVDLPTAGQPAGDQVLTLAWREALDSSGASPALLHTPWLRLEAAATFTDDGTSVVLAAVTLDASGAVTALSAGLRRLVSLPAGGLVFRSSDSAAGGSTIAESPGAQLQPRGDGGLEVVLPGSPAAALSLHGDGRLLLAGDVGIGTDAPAAALDVDRGQLTTPGLRLSAEGPGWGAGLQLSNRAGRTYGSYSGADGLWHFTDVEHETDRLTIDTVGNVRIGPPGVTLRPLHVEGDEVHSGGPGAGFSFEDRTQPGFIIQPTAGERWVWYAQSGYARLWSGTDQLLVGAPGEGGGLDVPRRARVRQGADPSAGIWLHQNGSGDAGFVGMADDTHIGFWGRGAGWALTLDAGTGAIAASGPTTISGPTTVNSTLRANSGITLPANAQIAGDGRLHITGGELLFLLNHSGVIVSQAWGGNGNLSVDGALQVHTPNTIPGWSGGGITTFDLFAAGGVYVGPDPANPSVRLYPDGRKQFVIDHPLDPENRSLHHVCVEGPEAAVFYRGSGRLADGRAEVELPAYFEALTRTDGRTVLLTPIAEDGEAVAPLAASLIREGRFTVRAAGLGNPAQRFSWQVTAVRSDVEPVQVETVKAGRVTAGVA